MMKRYLILALSLLMLLAVMPACAETQSPLEALYRIVLRTEAGDETLGTGVLFGDTSTILTSAGCRAEGEMYAIGADGEHRIAGGEAINGTRLLKLTLETPAAAQPLLATASSSLLNLDLMGATADGSFASMEVTMSRVTALDSRTELLLTAQEGLMPGAVMLGADGGLAIMTIAAYGEGEGVYLALSNVTLSSLLRRVEDDRDALLVEGFDVTCEDGVLTVDWSRASNIDATTGMMYTVYYSLDANPFLSYAQAEEGEMQAVFPAIPGAGTVIWIVASAQENAETIYPQYGEEMFVLEVPEGEPFTDYGFTNRHVGVAAGPAGMDAETSFLPEAPLTREILADPDQHIYFQTEDTYQVEAEDGDHALLVMLRTPEGYVLYSFGGYTFMPELCDGDLWLLDITELIETYEEFADKQALWPNGEYSILYYIDGCEVNRVTFTLD